MRPLVKSTQWRHSVTGCPGEETGSGGWQQRTTQQCKPSNYTHIPRLDFEKHKLASNIASNWQYNLLASIATTDDLIIMTYLLNNYVHASTITHSQIPHSYSNLYDIALLHAAYRHGNI